MNKHGYQFSIGLRIWHPSIDPERITERLGLEPMHTGRAGMPRTTPKGRPLAGTYQENYWNSGFLREGGWASDAPSEDLTQAIDELLSSLAVHKDFFRELRGSGGRAEISVGWFFDRNSGDVFRYDLFRKLADLHMDLWLDVYPPKNGANPEPPQTPEQKGTNPR